jgi:hypothetical protein
MFSFHHFLENSNVKKTVDKWAQVVSLYDRLHAHGFPVILKKNTSRTAEYPLVVEMGDWTLGPQGKFEPNGEGSYQHLERKNVENAASWVGISKDELAVAQAYAKQSIDLAIDRSIDAWLKESGVDFSSNALESRLYGMRKMGYDIHQWRYHETKEDNAASIIANGFDLSRVGARRSENTFPDGVFLKPNTDSLDLSDSPVQMPFFLKQGRTFKITSRDELDKRVSEIPSVRENKLKISDLDAHYGPLVDDIIEKLSDDPKNEDVRSDFDAAMGEWKSKLHSLSSDIRKSIQSHFIDEGFDFIEVKNDIGSLGRTVETTVALSASSVASARVQDMPVAQKPVQKTIAESNEVKTLGVNDMEEEPRRSPRLSH